MFSNNTAFKLKCFSDWICGCVAIHSSSDIDTMLFSFEDRNSITSLHTNLVCYVKPMTTLSIIVCGLFFSFVILFIISRETVLRECSSILISNIIFNDIIIQGIQLIILVHYYFKPIMPFDEFIFNDFLVTTRCFSVSVGMLSVLALNIERFANILRLVNLDKCYSSPIINILKYLVSIWISAFVICLITLFNMNSKDLHNAFSVMTKVLIFVFILVIGFSILNTVIAVKVRQLLERRFMFHKLKMLACLKTTLPLSAVFCVTHIPIIIWTCQHCYYGVHLRIMGIHENSFSDFILYHLYSCYAIFNSVALYFGDDINKRLFSKYFLGISDDEDENRITRSS